MKDRLKTIIKEYDYSIYAFLFTFLLGAIIFSLQGRLIGGNFTFMHCDMLNQMIPYIKMFLRQLLVDHNIVYSFDFALGSSTIPQYAFYSCFNPLNLIMLLPLDLNVSSFILVMTKLSLGAFMFHSLSYKITGKKDWLSVAISLSYALCGFNIAYYHVIIWLDGIYFLPVIVWMIIYMIKNNRNPWIVVAYASLFIVNFYSGYVVGLFTFVFFLLYLICIDKSEFRNKIRIIITYIMYVLLAVLLSAVVLLPTAISIIRYTPEDALGFDDTIINLLDLIKQFYIGQSVDEIGYYPYVYCGLVPLALFPLFFFNKTIKKNVKLFFALLVLTLTFFAVTMPGYKFIHAFNNPDNFGHRYAYLYCFVLLAMFSVFRKSQIKINKKAIVLEFVLLSAFVSVYSFLQKGPDYINNPSNSILIVGINILFLLVYMLLYVCCSSGNKIMYILSALIVCEMIINGYIYHDMYLAPVYEARIYFDYFYKEQNNTYDKLITNDDIFRVYMPNALFFDNPQLMGYGGVDSFSSILNQNLNMTMRNLGYRSNYLAMTEDGSTPLMRMLLGQNYYVYNNNLSTITMGYRPMITKAAVLPIAYMSSDDIVDVSLNDGNNPFENQNMFVSALCGEEIVYFINTGENIDITSDNVYIGDALYNDEQVVGFEIEDNNNPNGLIDFVDSKSNSKYAYFEMLDSYSYLRSPILFNDIEGYYLTYKSNALTEPKIIEMKQLDDGSHVYIIMNEDTDDRYYFKVADFYGTNDSELDKAYDILTSTVMNVEELKDGYVKGKVISSSEKDVLFTTIPYEEGWNVYIDGEKGNIISLIDGSFVGVIVPEGEHEIELKYTDRWAIRGGLLSLVGILGAVVVFCYSDKKKEKVISENDKYESN